MSEILTGAIQASIDLKRALLADERLLAATDRAAALLVESFRQGGKAMFCGNGGSAADAQHLAAELSGRFYLDRRALPAEALHTNSSYVTAVANDYGYEEIYARLVTGTGHRGDVLIGLSTSGNSANVVAAFHAAKALGIHTIALTGDGGGELAPLADILIAVPSQITPRIQECHMLLGHTICEIVEREFFAAD